MNNIKTEVENQELSEKLLGNNKKVSDIVNLLIDITKTFVLQVFVINLKLVYSILKLLPTKNKVLFISRQSSKPSLDYQMLIDRLEVNDVDIKILCRRVEKNIVGYIKYYFHIYVQMYHLATSKVCILDTYIIPVSVLKHKKSLTIIQLWHSIGKIKRSGYQTLGKDGGRDSVIAKVLKMHRNYDYIITGSKYWEKYYCLSFDTTPDKLLSFGLPRIDYLLETSKSVGEEIKSKYEVLNNGKKNVLYAPTFRRKRGVPLIEFIRDFDYENFNLILKLHPHDFNTRTPQNENIIFIEDYTSTQLLSVSDFLITDYSSISFEAALIDVKLLFYVKDYDSYMSDNGLNLELKKDVPELLYYDSEALINAINEETYDYKVLKDFKKKFLPSTLGESTDNIVKLVKESL